jgi:hypothetical protein
MAKGGKASGEVAVLPAFKQMSLAEQRDHLLHAHGVAQQGQGEVRHKQDHKSFGWKQRMRHVHQARTRTTPPKSHSVRAISGGLPGLGKARR